MKQLAYKRRMRKTFIVIAFCFVLCFGMLMSFIIISTQRTNFHSTLQHAIAAKSDSTHVATNTIFGSLRNLQESDTPKLWANSKNKREFHYYALKLYKEMSKTVANISLIDYNIFITLNNDDSFVVDVSGTMDKKLFFSPKHSNISINEWNKISSYFKNSDEPYIYPIYKNNALCEIYYIVKEKSNDQQLLYFVKIPANTFFGEDISQKYVLYNKDKLIAYSSLEPKTLSSLKKSYNFLITQKTSALEPYSQFVNSGKDIFLIRTSNPSLMFAYQFDFFAFSAPKTFGLILLLLLLFGGVSILVFIKLSDDLYRPIHEVISDVGISNSGESFDEFQIIRQNVSTVSSLNMQLQTAILEKKALATRRYYIELLYGVPDLNCPLTAKQMSASYCVALVEFQPDEKDTESDGWYLHLQKNFLYVYVQELYEKYNIHCVSVAYNTNAIILQTEKRELAQEIIMQFYNIPEITSKLKVALSNVREQVIHISDCYEEALHILEYRYTLPDAKILTLDYIKSLPCASYYYPMMLENRLIQSIASGNSDSLELYDNIIKENFCGRELSPDILRNLIFALVGTIIRVFQELKTTPDVLLKQGVDFQLLYNNWNNPQITEIIRDHIKNIITGINEKNESNDDELLQKMLDYIYQNYSNDIMLIDIAEYCNISPTYCSTLFKRLNNDNFKSFLNNYRIERACEILENNPDIKIVDLCTSVGFNSSNSFIRVFRKVTGLTPKAYAEKSSGSDKS